MVKNDHEYIHEWLNHHRSIGFNHFFIYDNESTPAYKDLGDDVTIILWDENQYFLLHPPIKDIESFPPEQREYINLSELVNHHSPNYPKRHNRQYKAYQHCLNNYGDNYDWIAFIDADEFIMLGENETLQNILQECDNEKNIGQLLLQWRMFSSSGHKIKQANVLESYTEWFPDYQYKPIVKPSVTYAVSFIHLFTLYPYYRSVNENKQLIHRHGSYPTHSSNRIWINHYWGKSRQDFEETKLKIKGGTTYNDDGFYESKYEFIEKRAKYHMINNIYTK
jgi:hypothetical protein